MKMQEMNKETYKQSSFSVLNEKFVDFADKVSSGMGSPLNILVWILLVLNWFLLFGLNPNLQNTNFLPQWFTSNAFNFPLNTVTTLAELYIGFLVAAAANRVERRNRALQEHSQFQMDKLEALEETMASHIEEMKQRLDVQDKALVLIREHLARQDQMITKIFLMLHTKGHHPHD